MVDNVQGVRRVPALPCPHLRVAGAEHEPALVDERRPDRGERRAQFLVGHEQLEDIARHDGQGELPIPRHARGRALDPLDVSAQARPVQRGDVRVEPAQPAGVPRLARGPAACRCGSRRPGLTGRPSRTTGRSRRSAPRVEEVVEGGGIGVCVHRGSMPQRRLRASVPGGIGPLHPRPAMNGACGMGRARNAASWDGAGPACGRPLEGRAHWAWSRQRTSRIVRGSRSACPRRL
jgi:hypothetical protein